jgi:glycine/D-amino acid oxidase-like deaminating enzyme
VAVVGGGVLGTSTAAHLAARGADVTLLTDAGLASGASGRSLSWLNSFGRHSPEYHRLRLVALERYRTLAAEVGAPSYLRFDGALSWAAPADMAAHRSAFRHMTEVGYPAEWLTPAELAPRVPGVNLAAIPDEGAIATPGEGWVDLPSLIDRLTADVLAHGGAVRTRAGHCEPVLVGGAAAGVRTGAGEVVAADAVVLATGADVPRAAARLGVHLPDATGPALLVRTPPSATRMRAVLNTPRVSVRPTPTGALVLDAAWSEREVGVLADGGFEVRASTVAGLLGEATAVLEGTPALTAESYGVGPKPVPGDGEPVLGELPGVPGCFVLFSHSGATLALIAGELLADEILTGVPSTLLDAFRPGRFRRPRPSPGGPGDGEGIMRPPTR